MQYGRRRNEKNDYDDWDHDRYAPQDSPSAHYPALNLSHLLAA